MVITPDRYGRLWRCGGPTPGFRDWLERNASGGLRIATYGLSAGRAISSLLALDAPLHILVGLPCFRSAPSAALPAFSLGALLDLLDERDRSTLLTILHRVDSWRARGAQVRLAPAGKLGGIMHVKLYLGETACLVGSANFTSNGLKNFEQQELLVELLNESHQEIERWWNAEWERGIPVDKTDSGVAEPRKGKMMGGDDAKVLLGHWLGDWGAWSLNGLGTIAYPHQIQAVEWIRPEGKAYLLGDEVGLGKTFTAAFLWVRHQQLYGSKARLLYITRPALIIDAITAFVRVLGVEELLPSTVAEPRTANHLQPRFGIFHAKTQCWGILPDGEGRKRNKDYHVASLVKENRYKVRPEEFLASLKWLTGHAAGKVHEQIDLTSFAKVFDTVYSFVSIDTIRGAEQPILSAVKTLRDASYVPLVIVDESHGLSRDSQRRKPVAELVWGSRDESGTDSLMTIAGSLVVYMSGTPVHPNRAETASRLGLLDLDRSRTPHPISKYDDDAFTKEIFQDVRNRAVLRRKEDITLDGEFPGVGIFPKRLVFPFQSWLPVNYDSNDAPLAFKSMMKDVLMALDQYIAGEASHGAKLFSRIRRVLRGVRQWKEIKDLAAAHKAHGKLKGTSLAEEVVLLTENQLLATTDAERTRWLALKLAVEAARSYEQKLQDSRLQNVTWKYGKDENGNQEKQMLFTKAGWVATVYDCITKGARTDENDDDLEDEDTAGDNFGDFETSQEMLEAAEKARDLADTYLQPVRLDDGSKVRFSMLVALLEGLASLRLWSKGGTVADEDRFGWGIEDKNLSRLKEVLENAESTVPLSEPWVIHARYIHSVVDTAVRLQLRYGRGDGVPIVGIIVGDTPYAKRDEIKEKFKTGELKLVCMSDAGAEGINLQRSNRIVVLDVPVSPGRIEQIAGRIHRLGSQRAAQVTLLLPPDTQGTRVFDALRRAASSVYVQAAGAHLPKAPEPRSGHDAYYIRQLAAYEARLLTAVAETGGAIGHGDDGAAIRTLMKDVEKGVDPINLEPLKSVLETAFKVNAAQKKLFKERRLSGISVLLPMFSDLADSLVAFQNGKIVTSTETYRQPQQIIDDPLQPERYGDLVMREEPFRVLEMGGKGYWYAPKRFLPDDAPKQADYRWLGVIGCPTIAKILADWRGDEPKPGADFSPKIWQTSGLPEGKFVAFCSIRPDRPAGEAACVLIGIGEEMQGNLSAVAWRPFFAKGVGQPLAVTDDTWLSKDEFGLDARWGAALIRRITGIDSTFPASSTDKSECAKQVCDTIMSRAFDEHEEEHKWILDKELRSQLGDWWPGKAVCLPIFLSVAFGCARQG